MYLPCLETHIYYAYFQKVPTVGGGFPPPLNSTFKTCIYHAQKRIFTMRIFKKSLPWEGGFHTLPPLGRFAPSHISSKPPVAPQNFYSRTAPELAYSSAVYIIKRRSMSNVMYIVWCLLNMRNERVRKKREMIWRYLSTRIINRCPRYNW